MLSNPLAINLGISFPIFLLIGSFSGNDIFLLFLYLTDSTWIFLNVYLHSSDVLTVQSISMKGKVLIGRPKLVEN